MRHRAGLTPRCEALTCGFEEQGAPCADRLPTCVRARSANAGAFVVASINDLTQRHGFGSVAGVRPPAFSQFSLRDDPDGLWVAEEGGDMRGFAFSWACGDLWFLAQLFVAPGRQGEGIGQTC